MKKKKVSSPDFWKKGGRIFFRYFRRFYYCHLNALFTDFYLLPGISWSPSLINEKSDIDNTNLFLLIHVLTLSPLKRTKPPMRIHVPSTECDVISFNGQGQLCLLTCAGWRDVSNYTRMSTIQSRRSKKKATHHVTLTWEFACKTYLTTHLNLKFLSSKPKKIVKAFPKTFPSQLWSNKCSAKRTAKNKKEKRKNWEERNQKGEVKTTLSLLKPKTTRILNIFFLHKPELWKLIFCTRNRKPWSASLLNNVLGHWWHLQL